MKISELLESKDGKVTKRQRESTRGLHIYSDGEKWSGDYTQYRVMMAAACTDGESVPDMDAKSWIGKYKTAHPYSEEDQKKLKMAYKAAGASYKDLNHGNLDSDELKSINTHSPVAKKKKNRYGI
jgi:hypothetical protein